MRSIQFGSTSRVRHGQRGLGRPASGFTLIELMIVVAILGVIAGVFIPLLLRTLRQDDAPGEALAVGGSVAELTGTTPADLPAAEPTLDEVRLEIGLQTSHHLQGRAVYTRFEATVEGRFLVRNLDPALERIALRFPFPQGTTEARGVALQVGRPGGPLGEPEQVSYSRQGIRWSGPLPRGEQLAVRVTYTAQGRDRFAIQLPGRGRVGQIHVAMHIAGMTTEYVPDAALQPTGVAQGRLVWELEHVVTDRPIMVELPAADSPIGRLILLSKLVGLALLLFGAGFWYLSEGAQPGRMRTFRWAHFSLLGLNYSLFFLVFAVLSLRFTASPWLPMGIAAGLTLPLQVLHLSRILDLRFALRQGLLLTLFTLALVIVGAYGAGVRDWAYLGASVLLVAYLTLTWRGWSEGRRRFREQQAREERLQARTEQLGRALAALEQPVRQATALLQTLDRTGGPSAEQGTRLREQRTRLEQALTRGEQLLASRHTLAAEPDELRQEIRGRELAAAATQAATELEAAANALREELDQQELQQRQAATRAARPAEELHCLACGQAGPPTPHCPACGVPRPVRVVCEGCGQAQRLPLHWLARNRRPMPLHCPACGARLPEGTAV